MSWIEETLEAATPRRDVWFESAGTRLYALEAGTGRAIVFLHGGLADHRAALIRTAPLSAAYRLLLPDLRGSGRSHYRESLGWDQLADDVIALLDHLGIERAIVGGTSMGSGVALRCVLRHRQRVAGAILSSVVYPGEDRGLSAAPLAAMRSIGELGERASSQGVEALVPLFERLPSPMRERALEMLRGFDAQSVVATARFLASNVQPLASVSELCAIAAPVLLIPGSDPEHPAEVAELYAEHLPRHRMADPASPELLRDMAVFCAALED